MAGYDRALARTIMTGGITVYSNGLEIHEMPIPDDIERGVMDKREYMIRKAVYEFQKRNPAQQVSVAFIREHTATYTTPVDDRKADTGTFVLDGAGVIAYNASPEHGAGRAAFVYIHGGSFFAGRAASYDIPCAFLSNEADCAVFNIDYSLAPEHPFPCAARQCAALIKHIYDNCDKYGVDKNRIFLGGDSAGGNIALSAYMMRDESVNIAHMALFYPCVDMWGRDGLYDWRQEDYEISEAQSDVIVSRLGLGRADGKGAEELMEMLSLCYLSGGDADKRRNPVISPIYADLSDLPPVTMFTAEFDGLRPQEEYFALRMKESGKYCRVIRYRGVSHAFLDYFGTLPQAEAALLELADIIKDNNPEK